MSCAVGVGRSRSSAKRVKIVEAMDPSDRAKLERLVPRHIASYFNGVDVPEGVDLVDPRYVDLCIRTGICEAVDMAYGAMGASGRFRGPQGDGSIGEDVEFVIAILRGIRARCVPQEFSAGILLMHLEILEGFTFSTATSSSCPTS